MIASPESIREWPLSVKVGVGLGVIAIGAAVAWFYPIGIMLAALAVIVIATRYVETLAVATFWTLPYMILNVPTGSFTVQLPEAVAYVFGAAAIVRVLLRRERLALPPMTLAVLIFIAVGAFAAAQSMPIAIPLRGAYKVTDRNSPELRSFSYLIWWAISWMVVVGLYNVVRNKPEIYRRCVIAHCLSGGVASAISMGIFILSFFGIQMSSFGGKERGLVDAGTNFFRLAGVAYEPLILAFYLQTVIPATAMILMLKPDWIPRRVATTMLVLQLTAFFFTFSSGGIAGVVAIVIFMAPFLRRAGVSKAVLRKIVMWAAAAVLILGVIFVAVEGVLAQFGQVFNKISGVTESTRAEQWKVAFAIFPRFPLLGVGPGMSTFYFPLYDPDIRAAALFGAYEINNLPLGIIADVGLLGLAALIGCTVSGFRHLYGVIQRFGPARTPTLLALTASLIGCAVQSMGMSIDTLIMVYFTGILSLAVAASHAEPLLSVPTRVEPAPVVDSN